MYAPTHVVDVLTGTAVDDYGDAEDATTVAAASVPVSILERSSTTHRYDSQDPRTITTLAGRAPAGTVVDQGDRLRDTRTGQLWLVDSVSQNANPVAGMDMTMELRRLP